MVSSSARSFNSSFFLLLIIINDIYIAQVRRGHKCAMPAEMQYGHCACNTKSGCHPRSSIRLTDSLVEPVLKKVSLTVSTMPSIH